MELCNSPDISQEKMNELFKGLDCVRIYLDDLLIISNNSLEDQIKKLDKVLSQSKSVGFKLNEEKSFFCQKMS